MNESVTVSMPLFLMLGKDGSEKYYINLNNYRNWHYIVNNNLKKLYKKIAWSYIYKLKFEKRITIEFVLWRADKRSGDRSNVLSIHEKFFCDALTTSKCIPDDNDKYIYSTSYRTGGIDKDNPRVDIHITEIDHEELFSPM